MARLRRRRATREKRTHGGGDGQRGAAARCQRTNSNLEQPGENLVKGEWDSPGTLSRQGKTRTRRSTRSTAIVDRDLVSKRTQRAGRPSQEGGGRDAMANETTNEDFKGQRGYLAAEEKRKGAEAEDTMHGPASHEHEASLNLARAEQTTTVTFMPFEQDYLPNLNFELIYV